MGRELCSSLHTRMQIHLKSIPFTDFVCEEILELQRMFQTLLRSALKIHISMFLTVFAWAAILHIWLKCYCRQKKSSSSLVVTSLKHFCFSQHSSAFAEISSYTQLLLYVKFGKTNSIIHPLWRIHKIAKTTYMDAKISQSKLASIFIWNTH